MLRIMVLVLSVLAASAASANEPTCEELRERARYKAENLVRAVRERLIPVYERMVAHLRANDYTPEEKRFLRQYASAYINCDVPYNPARCTPDLLGFLKPNWQRGIELQRNKVAHLNRTLPAAPATIAGLRLLRTYDFVLDEPGRYGQVLVRVNLGNPAFDDEPVKEVVLGAFQYTEHVGLRKPSLGIYYEVDGVEERFEEAELRDGLTVAIEREFVRRFAYDMTAACRD